jgi:nicotinate-nucleotide--dimethylbenzimidazole phosphoribosyltransferase
MTTPSGPAITPPDAAAAEAVRAAAHRGGPLSGLGRMVDLAAWVAGVQERCPPRAFERIGVVLFADDPAVAHPAASALAAAAGARLGGLTLALPAAEPAGRVTAAYANGQRAADAEVDEGTDLLLLGAVDGPTATAAATVVAILTGAEPVAVVDRGGVSDERWMREVVAVRDLLRKLRADVHDPMAILERVGDVDLAALTGFLVQAAARRTPVWLDGPMPCAAALLAERLAPGVVEWFHASHRSPAPAHGFALAALDLEPALDLRIRAEGAVGALVALPLLQAAVSTVVELWPAAG